MKHKLVKEEYYLKELFCIASSYDNYTMGNLNIDCIYNNTEGNSITISKFLNQDDDYWSDDSIVLELLLLLDKKNSKEYPISHWFYPSLNNRFWVGYDDSNNKYVIVPENVNALLTPEKQEAFIKELFRLLKIPLVTY